MGTDVRLDCGMTAQGRPYARFKRALELRSVFGAEMAAREMGRLGLNDALDYLVLLAAEKPERFDRSARKWLARLLSESPALTLDEAVVALGIRIRSRRCGTTRRRASPSVSVPPPSPPSARPEPPVAPGGHGAGRRPARSKKARGERRPAYHDHSPRPAVSPGHQRSRSVPAPPTTPQSRACTAPARRLPST
jgi:hypothetical protein